MFQCLRIKSDRRLTPMYRLGLNLYHRPTYLRRKILIVVTYIGFLTISLLPLIADAVSDIFCPPNHPNCPFHERDPIFLFEGLHIFLLVPFFTTIPLIIGIYKQVRRPLQTQTLTGLKLQTAAFMLSAVFWIYRVSAPWDLYRTYLEDGHPIILALMVWYQMVGFVTINDALFALGQGIFLWLALRQNRRAEEGERQPLLA